MTRLSGTAEWIAVDWGTSRLRVWAMAEERAIADAASGAGMGTLRPDGYEPALLNLVGDWLGEEVMPVIACGMVGARQGWVEAPYATVPGPPLSIDFAQAPTQDRRLDVHIIPGLKSLAPADVMRGEETQIAGFLSKEPDFAGTLCLPGTHTKWVRIADGEVAGFSTSMTGELFALLEKHSVLSHVLGDGWDGDAFLAGVAQTFANPATLTERLFGLRASALLEAPTPGTLRARASGYLIGSELAGTEAAWRDKRVVLLGDATLSEHYANALRAVGTTPELTEATAATLAGLTLARQRLGDVMP